MEAGINVEAGPFWKCGGVVNVWRVDKLSEKNKRGSTFIRDKRVHGEKGS